jgi:hypothetical protein
LCRSWAIEARSQGQRGFDHPQAIGRFEVVARNVQTLQVLTAERLQEFAATTGKRHEDTRPIATRCG